MKSNEKRSYVTKTVEYADLFDDKEVSVEHYLHGINKRWLIEGVVHMISVDRFDSFSMRADKGLLVMFQDYRDRLEVKRLFSRMNKTISQYPGVWLTLINHRALFCLLKDVLMMPNEREGIGESYEAYEGLLRALLASNSAEMRHEAELLKNISVEPDVNLRDAMIVMQQDVLSLDLFGENKKELEKSQMLKYLALCEFGKKHPEVGRAIKRVVKKHGFQNEWSYMLLAQMPLAVYHDKDGFGEGLIVIRRKDLESEDGHGMWGQFVSYVEDKSIDIWDVEKMKGIFTEEELLDNTCFRKYPVLKMSNEEYLIVSQLYYSHLFYDGFWWAVKEEMSKEQTDAGIFTMLTRDFSEKYLFSRLVKQMVGEKRMRIYNDVCFDDQQSAPDISVMNRKHLFLYEFKDMRIKKQVADGSDMSEFMGFLDDRLNKGKGDSGKNKGLPQLVGYMEDYFSGKEPWRIGRRRGRITVHPILVVNSRLFGVRGINDILQRKLNQRIQESPVLKNHTDEIGKLLVIDFDMLVLVAAWAHKDYSKFQSLMYSYLTYVRKAQTPFDRCTSYRHFVMNKWEDEMNKKDLKKFERGYKSTVRYMTGLKHN